MFHVGFGRARTASSVMDPWPYLQYRRSEHQLAPGYNYYIILLTLDINNPEGSKKITLLLLLLLLCAVVDRRWSSFTMWTIASAMERNQCLHLPSRVTVEPDIWPDQTADRSINRSPAAQLCRQYVPGPNINYALATGAITDRPSYSNRSALPLAPFRTHKTSHGVQCPFSFSFHSGLTFRYENVFLVSISVSCLEFTIKTIAMD